jgi:hypothetical protein
MKIFIIALIIALCLSPIAAWAQDSLELPSEPAPHSSSSRIDRVFSIVAWPGYGAVARDRSTLGKSQKLVFAGERMAFAFDLGTSGLGMCPHSRVVEADPLNTLFGNQNKTGIFSSMTGWEMGYSYTAAVIPRWFEPTKYRKPVRVLALIVGGFLTEEHVRSGVCNLQIARQSAGAPARSCSLF